LSPHPPQPSFIAPPSTSPSPPPSALFDCRVSADFYAFISIFTPPPLRQYPLKRVHHQTDILMLLVVVLPFAHLMDFAQTEHSDVAHSVGMTPMRLRRPDMGDGRSLSRRRPWWPEGRF